MKTLRDYQQRAISGNDRFPGINRALTQNRSTVCVMATGLGKSVVAAMVMNDWTRGNVLCLAHRIELLDQMADHLAQHLGYRPSVEQGPRGLDRDTLFAAGHVVVGSIQSMITERRLKKFKNHSFGLIVIDECHRATAPSYVKLVEEYTKLDPELRVLGLTATPNRTDGTALGLVFQSVAFEMGICAGIDQGWLVDIHQKFAVVEELTLDKVPLTTNEFGEKDFQAKELETLLSQEGSLHAMSRPILDCTANGEQAIIFTASVNHAHLLAAVLNHSRPGCAGAVDGTMAKGEGGERTEIVRRFKDGDLQFLLNFNIATEGFDAPRTAFVVMGRPTKSQLVYTQALGRCTRPLPGLVDGLDSKEARKDAIAASEKPYATVLDFVGASRLGVVAASDVLGGNYDVDTRDLADEIVGAQRNGNVRDALTKARASLLLAADEEQRRPMRNAIGEVMLAYRLTDAGGFNSSNAGSVAKTSRGGSTDAQVAALVNLGVGRNTALGYSKRQASAVIDSLRQKRCTIKQAATLVRFGHDPSAFNAESASKKIDEIAAAGWRHP
jgi:superfamily II DNA or RNA helicase